MKIRRLVIAASAIVLLTGCSVFLKDKAAADKAVVDFHQQFNDDKTADIYTASHSGFKAASTQQEFTDLMAAVRRKLGKVVQSTNVGFNVRSFNLVTTVYINQQTTFEQGKGIESFTFQMSNGQAVLQGYHISSKELILK